MLSPQHFQQQALWEELANRHTALLASPFLWGLQALSLDEMALQHGKLKIEMVKAQFKDGTLIDSENAGGLPSPRSFEADFPTTVNHIQVWLGIAELDQRGSNLTRSPEQKSQTPRRYSQHIQTVTDLLGDYAQDIAVEHLETRLFFDYEPRDHYTCLPILRLQRDQTSHFSLDKHYIPPVLSISANTALLNIADRLAHRLYAKHAFLSEQRRARSMHTADFNASDVLLFCLLHSINQTWPELHHLTQHPSYHPQTLFLSLITLAAKLSAFTFEYDLSSLPNYEHDQLEIVFYLLETMINGLLDGINASALLNIELTHPHPTRWFAHLNDPRLVNEERIEFYLSVSSAVPVPDLDKQFLAVCKVGAPEDIERLLPSATHGVPLISVQRLPAALPARLDNHYFRLDRTHPTFGHMLAARTCCFYVPLSLPDIQLEFYALQLR